MIKIGLTGGIGSGKTTVAGIFETLGIPVYYADNAAKRIMNENESLRKKIIEHFCAESYKHKQLNRHHLATVVFNNVQKLALLNSLVHPLTFEDAEKWIKQQKAPYIIKEAALMFESDAWKYVDKVVGVSAPYKLRVQRTMERDHTSKEAIDARISKQMNEEEKMKRCDYVLINDEKTLLIPQVTTLHEKLIAAAHIMK
jgi:dephospho-CoA kinase